MRSGRASAGRTLVLAFAASILLHALVLAAEWPRLAQALRSPVEALAPIVARLVEPAPPPPAPAPPPATVEQPSPAPEPKPKPKPKPKALAKPRSEAPARPSVAEKPAAKAPPEPAAAPAPAPAPAPQPAPAPAPPSAPAIAKAVPAPAPGATAPAVPDTESLIAQYRAALLAEARRHRVYPLAAVDSGLEGEVVVRMSIGTDGGIAALEVKSSSGHAVLDRQALEMFRRAKPQVAIPAALRGRPFSLELRAVFDLKDQGSG